MRRFIEYTWIPLTRTCFVLSLVETGSVVPEKAFILRWRKTWPFISKNVNLPLPKVAVCQFRLKLIIYIRRQDGYLGFFDSKRRKDDRPTKRIVKKKMAQITHNRNQCSYPVADGIFNYASWSGLCSQGLCRFLIFLLLILNQIIAVTWLKYCRYDVKLYPINQSINQNVFWGRSFPPIHIMLVSK